MPSRSIGRRVALSVGVSVSLCMGLWAVAGAASALPAKDSDPLPVSQVAAGVFVHFGALEEWQPRNAGDVANLGFVVGSRCVAVIDTGGTPQVGRRLLAAVRQASPLPVCYVINTHAHPDHMLGNVAFTGLAQEPARFVGSARLDAALAARERHYLNTLQRDFGLSLPREAIVHPNLMVDELLELDLGGRVLQLNAWPTAHTDHDLTVYDRKTRTLFLSDLLFVSHLPVLDGKLRGWLGVMASIKSFAVALAIPGHGAASADWPAVMTPQWNYLDSLLVQTRAAIKAKMTIQQAVDSVPLPADAKWQLTDLFHRRNVTAAYAELEWED
jgi:quinoprotein relay system zinc metallohydrolase 2